jgi:hypothetical protein
MMTERHLPVVNDKVRERELVWIEHKRRKTQGENRDPEVDQEWRPHR